MDLFKQVVELVGFDIAFLGTLTVLWLCLLKFFWDVSRTEVGFVSHWTGVRTALKNLVSANATLSWPKTLVVVFVAALTGMVVNIASDELLDEELTLEALYVPTMLRGDRGCDEDCVKERAINKAAELHVASAAQQLVASHAFGAHATALMQHVYAEVQKGGNDRARAQLNAEFLVVKTLRVLWLDVLGLALLFLAATVWTLVKPRTLPEGGRVRRRAAILSFSLALVAIVCSQGLLKLWSEQSGRYYLKLLHAYIVQGTGTSLLLPHAAKTGKGISQFTELDGFVTAADFKNRDGDKTKMYEFSAITTVSGRTIVADNETGKLTNPQGEQSSPKDLALFDVRLRGDTIAAPPARAWPEAFPPPGPKAKDLAFDDIEGLAASDDVLYMIGSHGVDSAGTFRPERQVLMRFDTGGDRENRVQIYRGLMAELVARAESLGLEPKLEGSPGQQVIKHLNIEGLAFVPDTHDLLLGLRSPLIQGKAVVLIVNNVDAAFRQTNGGAGSKEHLEISIYALLDLRGQGISALEYDPVCRQFMVGSSPPQETPGEPPQTSAWRWQHQGAVADALAESLRFHGHKLEGIARIPSGELMLAFDEEEKADGKPSEQFGRLVVFGKKKGVFDEPTCL